MAWDDDVLTGLGGAASGAGAGAAAGSMFGPIGTGIGAVGGGLLGLFGAVSGKKSRDAAHSAQRRGLDAAMQRLQQFSAQQYQNRMGDLDKTMSFYGPAERYLQSIYGPQASGTPGAGPPPGPGMTPPGFPKLPPDLLQSTPRLPPGPKGHF